MTKTELIEQVSKETERVTKSDVAKIINSTFDTISKSLKDCNTITLIGFVTLSVSSRKARTGRNQKWCCNKNFLLLKCLSLQVGRG